MKKPSTTALILLAVGLLAVTAQAQLGWTLAECNQHYGQEILPSDTDATGKTSRFFQAKFYGFDLMIEENFSTSGKVISVSYVKDIHPFPQALVTNLLHYSLPTADWVSGPRDADVARTDGPHDGLTWTAGNEFAAHETTVGRSFRYCLTIFKKEN
jgi:hypothetical protein